MILSFANKEIREICEDENKAKLILGLDVAIKLQSRLAELRAYYFADEVIFGSPITTNNTGFSFPVYRVDLLIKDFKLIFCGNHIKNPLKEDGSIDWTKVSRIKILHIDNN